MVFATFFADGSPLKLAMLNDHQLSALLLAIQTTSHHTVFKPIYNECLVFMENKFRAFRYNAIARVKVERRRAKSGRTFALLNGFGFIMLNLPLVLYRVPKLVLLILAFLIFFCIAIACYNTKKLSSADFGSTHSKVHIWEAFLTKGDYIDRRKEATLFRGIARKESAKSWSPEFTTRFFHCNNLCLATVKMLERTFGECFALLFNDHVVEVFHEYFYKKFEKEVWIEEPTIYQYHDIVLYRALFFSLAITSLITFFFMYCRSTLG